MEQRQQGGEKARDGPVARGLNGWTYSTPEKVGWAVGMTNKMQVEVWQGQHTQRQEKCSYALRTEAQREG